MIGISDWLLTSNGNWALWAMIVPPLVIIAWIWVKK